MGIAADHREETTEPTRREWLVALVLAVVFVLATRWPVARAAPLESDEVGFLAIVAKHRLPMHHTLFLALGRSIGEGIGDVYRGFLVLDMATSVLALLATWWWLRALVNPRAAAIGTLLLGVAPTFWTYGAMAANYTAIPLVGAILLGMLARPPRRWHPFVGAVVLAVGTGYRTDLGLLWGPVFGLLAWRHRWWAGLAAAAVFLLVNFAWFGAMIADVGGWEAYRRETARFADRAGYGNSVLNLGLVDGPVRYAVKIALALAATLGPLLLFVPSGLARLWRSPNGPWVSLALLASVLPSALVHLLIHFGMSGYAFHYVPALLALGVLGIGPARRMIPIAIASAAFFLFYPANFDAPGWRGSVDMTVARHTRTGLAIDLRERAPAAWRTANSERFPEDDREGTTR